MFLTAGVTEGAQYKISEIKVSGDTILPQEDVERMVIQKPGDTFSRALLEFSSTPSPTRCPTSATRSPR